MKSRMLPTLSILIPLLLTSCRGYETSSSRTVSQRPAPGERTPAHADEITSWRAQRLSRLQAEDGWLSLAGLYWLEEGVNRVGSAENSRVILPKGRAPELAAILERRGSEVRFQPVPGVPVMIEGKPATPTLLRADNDGEPTVLQIGSVTFYVIARGDRLGIRVKDSESEARKQFTGIPIYSVDEKWRVEATFLPYDPPKQIPIANVIGIVEQMQSPGSLSFSIDGKPYKIDPVVEEGSDELFLIFRDATSGKSTYGAGRYLYAARPKGSEKVVIDFNKAYNPPCAFTPFATCPLPPAQNRLAVAIEAGEKTYGVSH